MSGRYAPDPRSQVSVRDPSGGRRSGPHVGRVRVTPLRVTLLVALAGGLGFLAWSVLIRDALQVPLMATGFAICGIVFAVVSALSVAAVVRAGRDARDAAAVLTALAGGILAVMALMSLAAAVILSLIWSSTPGA